MGLGARIKEARKARGFTLKELGEVIDIDHSALSKIENEKNEASRKTLIALAKTLDNDFGEKWLDEYLKGNEAPLSKKEIAQELSARELLSLKFGGGKGRRSSKEAQMLAALLDAEIERMERER